MKSFLLYALVLLSFDIFAQKHDTIDLQKYFGNFTGGFCVYDLKTDKYITYNPKHCETRFSPCSSFKIPNSLIGLETGVISDTGFVIKYDPIRHPKDSFKLATVPFKYWYNDLSLKMAFKYSCVWYFQELARKVGASRMAKKVKDLNYGNNDISSGLDTYWVCGSIQISTNEQVDFLKRLYAYQLPGFSAKSIDAVKSIMLYETTDNYKLYAKSGTGDCVAKEVQAWYVGFVETASGPKFFALHLIVNSFDDLKNNFRIELTKKILRDLKII